VSHGENIDMQRFAVLGVIKPEPRTNGSPPIATLRHVGGVSEVLCHELIEVACHGPWTHRARGPRGKPKPWKRRGNDVKGLLGGSAKSLRVSQWFDNVEELTNAARPSMRYKQRRWIGATALLKKVVRINSIDTRLKMVESIKLCLMVCSRRYWHSGYFSKLA